jgi:hypothetical protein
MSRIKRKKGPLALCQQSAGVKKIGWFLRIATECTGSWLDNVGNAVRSTPIL